MAVYDILEAIVETSKLALCHITEAKSASVVVGTENDALKLLGSHQAALILEHILETLVATLAKLSRSCLNVLVGKGLSHIARLQAILSHLVGLEPHAH